ncbi:hypothetical protein HG535_0F02460 [Zygotorulaspora mrakii]|uniref:Uncharacterized protein n=1 Tax=Zygotorulaspora mrakii TaxID=42260 RepID=A0A7H9B4Y1_ZYGMR|nr:uncharacterized protein HG535_0F02460 [Zygotorulaspora mrakii]QLG73735.1 hypothetical protein HG535_0F02460 [Zygotorulaspora mrakii]
MSLTKSAILIALAVAGVSAIEPIQSAEINVILSDARGHLQDYMSVMTTINIPPAIMEIGMAMATATDDSYTTYYSEIDFDQVNTLVRELPWYSSRLAPALTAAMSTVPTGSESDSSTSTTGSSSAVPSTSSVSSSSAATSSSETSSSEVASSSSGASSSSEVASSSSSASSSSEVASSAVASSTVASSSEIMSSTMSSSSTGAVPSASQTINGAAKAAVGMGIGCVGAAAFLL